MYERFGSRYLFDWTGLVVFRFVSFCSGTWPQPKPFQASIDWVKSDFQSEWNEEIYKHTGHKVHGKNHLIYTIIRLFLLVVHLFIGVALSRCLVFFCRVDFDGVLCVLMIFFFFEEFNQMIRARCLMQHVDFIILFLYRKYFLCLVFKITRRSTEDRKKEEKNIETKMWNKIRSKIIWRCVQMRRSRRS